MESRGCFDDAIQCPDVECPKCKNPFTTWIWKGRLIFTCPECNEMGFPIEGLDLDMENQPGDSFITELNWPCRDDPDPECRTLVKMMFVERYSTISPPLDKDRSNVSMKTYSDEQRLVGHIFDRIVDMMTVDQ
jgi:hypothetical protein